MFSKDLIEFIHTTPEKRAQIMEQLFQWEQTKKIHEEKGDIFKRIKGTREFKTLVNLFKRSVGCGRTIVPINITFYIDAEEEDINDFEWDEPKPTENKIKRTPEYKKALAVVVAFNKRVKALAKKNKVDFKIGRAHV